MHFHSQLASSGISVQGLQVHVVNIASCCVQSRTVQGVPVHDEMFAIYMEACSGWIHNAAGQATFLLGRCRRRDSGATSWLSLAHPETRVIGEVVRLTTGTTLIHRFLLPVGRFLLSISSNQHSRLVTPWETPPPHYSSIHRKETPYTGFHELRTTLPYR